MLGFSFFIVSGGAGWLDEPGQELANFALFSAETVQISNDSYAFSMLSNFRTEVMMLQRARYRFKETVHPKN